MRHEGGEHRGSIHFHRGNDGHMRRRPLERHQRRIIGPEVEPPFMLPRPEKMKRVQLFERRGCAHQRYVGLGRVFDDDIARRSRNSLIHAIKPDFLAPFQRQ